jgi:hypothetical protein
MDNGEVTSKAKLNMETKSNKVTPMETTNIDLVE